MIKLNVKSPTCVEDKILDTKLEATVKDVKCQIEREWPSNPPPKDQRLVYAGKLLQDSSVLKDVLRLDDARDENDAFTIHLVCRVTNSSSSDQAPQLRKRNTTAANDTAAAASSADSVNSGTQSNFNDSQAALMQQMYANYMTQYVQYLQSIGAMNSWPASATQSLVDHTNQVAEEARAGGQALQPQAPVLDQFAAAAVAGAVANNLQHQAPINPPAVAPENNPPVNVQENNIAAAAPPDGPNVVLNAGAGGIGAMEDDDELNGGQRDVLDWCYVVTRVLVLFSVVYFYSSLARFALAAGLGIIFYLYNHGFFGQPQQQAPRGQDQHDAAVNEVRQVAGAAGGDQPAVQENEEEAHGNEEESPNNAEPAPVPPPHPLTVLSTFVTTFFTSLLPNDPQIV